MPIKLAIFDIAGTTLADDNAVFTAFRKAFETHGYDVSEEMVNPLMGYKKPVAVKMMLEKLNVKPEPHKVEEIHDFFVDEMVDYYEFSPNVRSIQGAEEAMWALKDKGIRIALNTGFSREITDAILDRMQWVDMGLVDDYIASDEVENGRPDPSMIRKLMERAEISDPKEVVKIGDTEVDINEGKNAGCALVIAVTTGAFTKEQLEEYSPDHIISNLSELSSILFGRA